MTLKALKIKSVTANNRKRIFTIVTKKGEYTMPYTLTAPQPSPEDRLVEVFVDPELGREAITYRLESGADGAIHVDSFLYYHRDPDYMADLLLHKISIEAQERMEETGLGTREVARRLGTSTTQLYRLLDQTNYKKSLRQMVELLIVLGCEVDFSITSRKIG